jgi:hypothetical protein
LEWEKIFAIQITTKEPINSPYVELLKSIGKRHTCRNMRGKDSTEQFTKKRNSNDR